MKPMITGLAMLWSVSALVSSAPAQPELDRRATIDVTAAAPHDVYASLSRALGYELAITSEVRQPVTMHLENVTIRTALIALSESLDCQWSIVGHKLQVEPAKPGAVVSGAPGATMGRVTGGVVGRALGIDVKQRLERKTPANFSFPDAPLRSVIEALGMIADLEIELDDPFDVQHVTVDLSNRTILSALRAIQGETGMVFVATFSGSDKKLHLKVGLPKP
ncbi:MAG: hypothetical protein H6R26_961 [Proteobacteria bacterium]|nr:hypothetical protein [Pseudomonadota bacterium]